MLFIRSLIAVLAISLALPASADSKVTELTSGTSPQSTDLFYIVRPGTAPYDFKLTWAQMLAAVGLSDYLTTAAASSTYLAKASNLSDLSSASTARTNLGLGTIATASASAYLAAANNLSDLASTSTARTNLGLGTIATQAASSVAITGGAIDGTTLGATTASSVKATSIGISGGSAASPAIYGIGVTNGATTGIFWPSSGNGHVDFTSYTGAQMRVYASGVWIQQGSTLGFGSLSAGGPDATVARADANSLVFGPFTNGAGAATTRTEINKAIATIPDATPTATLTVTVPNAAHSAMLKVTLMCSLGAGGALGANEATGTISYDIAIARRAGVNAVATASSAYGSATSAVSGAATITVAGAVSSISGAVGATNTFTVNATVTRGSGSSTNHTCQVYGRLLNANSTGITLS